MAHEPTFDPKLDLVFERTTALRPEQLWKGWTDPETLVKWFCPKPWRVTECRIDLRPGGEFFAIMEGPAGEKMENRGCYLEVVKDQRLVWTNTMTGGYRPALRDVMGFPFTGIVTFSRVGNQTLYRAVVIHGDEASRLKHEQMGFQEGWGAALKQLEEVYKASSSAA